MIILLSCSKPSEPAPSAELLVAVAASVQWPVDEIAAQFQKEAGVKVTISAGASGILQRQAEEGAPFDVFLGADMERVDTLARKGVIDPATVAPYARGVLMLWQPVSDAPLMQSVDDLGRPPFDRMRIGMANPSHAPYGMAARQALERLNLWERLEPNIVYGENVGQVFQFTKTGNVGAAFLPLSLVQVDWDGVLRVDESLYDSMLHGMGIMARTKERAAAEAFCDYLQRPESSALFERYGFIIPASSESPETE